MNPENPPAPREEIEMRLTALLMGELPPEEAAALQARMAAEPELAALHGRLRKAMELLREATALPEQDAPAAPVQLSSERRERLLAHFKKPVPTLASASIVKKPRRDWSWAVPLSLAAAVIVVIGGSLMMPAFTIVQVKARRAVPRELLFEEQEEIRTGAVGAFGSVNPSSATRSVEVRTMISSMDRSAGASTRNGYGIFSTPPPVPPQGQIHAAASPYNVASTVAVPPVPTLVTSSLLDAEPAVSAKIPPAEGLSTWNLGKVQVANSNETTANIQLPDGAIPEDQKQPFTYDFNGTGVQTLSGSNTFTGGVTVAGATLSGAEEQTNLGVNITGNTRTKDKVIRRSFPLTPGDVFKTAPVDAAKQRLMNTKYFSKVETPGMSPPPGTTTINGGTTLGGNITGDGRTKDNTLSNNAYIVKDGIFTTSDNSVRVDDGGSGLTMPGFTSDVSRDRPAFSLAPDDVFNTVRVDAGGAGLAKAGSGTLAITGANTYTGATTINGGTLSMASGAIVDDSVHLSARSPGVASLGALAHPAGNDFYVGTGATAAVKEPLTVTANYGDTKTKITVPIKENIFVAGGTIGISHPLEGNEFSRREAESKGTPRPGTSLEFATSDAPAAPLPAMPPAEAHSLKALRGDPDSPNAGTLTAGNGGNLAINPNAIDALLFPVNGEDKGATPAAPGLSPPPTIAGEPAREKQRPADYEARGREAIAAGDAAMKEKDYAKATAYYKNGCDIISNAPKSQSLYNTTLKGFSEASTRLAEQRITEGRYADAENTLRTVLDERYDPRNKKAIIVLSRLEQPDYYNKTIGPKLRASSEQVKQLFVEAQGLYDTGRFNLAKTRCEQILNIDPTNIAARQFEEKIDHSLSDYGVASYNETRADSIAKTDMAWARPLRRFTAPVDIATENDSSDPSTERIRRKLDSIIIPKLDLREATIGEALAFLKKKSAELDATSPVGQKGANIVLKLGDTPGAVAATPAAAGPPPATNPADAKITVSLANIPLGEALKYVTGLANMKYKVEPYAISVVPVTENSEVFVTKEWKIPPGLIPKKPDASGNGIADRESAKNWLIANGVQFNGNASAVYILKSDRLVVRNTQDQLDLVDSIIAAQPPAKVEEAAKPAASAAPIPQPEISTSENAFSTFSLNVSDVSFKLAEASLQQGRMPDPSTVRSEEFINAFDYRDPEPVPGAPLAFAAERARYPFAQNRDLLRFSVKTAAAGRQPGRPLNIVLLLDKSGSMERADRVNIVHEALRILAAQLQPQDKLSIVTFARTPRLWADGVAGDKAGEMIARVGEITPEGGTNLEAALDLGYATAQRHYAAGSINRVVLFTDGAANLGDVDPDALTKKVEAHRKQGVALDCFGIGWEGYNDDLLEQLTRNGDGRYGFINTADEAAANFAAQLAGALQVAASDVKVQVEFNPKRVTAYRQIGYAKHQLTKEQFRDNTVAAAQIGAAESGNALYVVEVDPHGAGNLATVRVRFRVPGTSDYREHEWTVPFSGNAPALEQGSSALRLAGTASAFSEMLAASPYAGDVSSDRLLRVLEGIPAIYGADPRPKQLEWMIRQARSLSGR